MSNRTRSGNGSVNVSIQDVAREAGVATSTVSRALTMPGRIAEKTRDRVLEAATRLGYTPNAAARTLRVGRSRVVLIILAGAPFVGASQVIPEVLRVIDAELAALGYTIVISNNERHAETDRYVLNLALSGAADGAIVLASGVPRSGERSFIDSGVPLVSALFDLSREGVPSVVTNDRVAAREAIAHLLALGHRHFLYGGGPRSNYHEVERHAGVEEALAGRTDCSLVYVPGTFEFASGTVAAETFLAAKRRPTAAFFCNDDMAIAFIRRLADAGVATPRDVAVIGFDGSAVGAYTVPSLSSVRQPTTDIGQSVVRTLINLMEKKSDIPLRTVVPSTLLLRESVASPPPPRPLRSRKSRAS